MSVPNIPNITPKIHLKDKDVSNLLLSSIALEEVALSNIMEAESLKLTTYINNHASSSNYFEEVCVINKSIDSVLEKVHSIESLLINKVKLISEMNLNTKKHSDKTLHRNSEKEKTSCLSKCYFNSLSTPNCDFSFNKDKC